MKIAPFEIAIPQARLDWIARRLADAHWPTSATGEPWHYGTELPAMRDLVDHWLHRYDWRAREAALNRLPQFTADTEVDGAPYHIHFLHVRAANPDAPVVLLSHGWPGSFVEFLDAIPLLTDPGAHGGDPADAVTVVAPSLIGYGFSSKPAKPIGPRTIARAFDAVMREGLGYDSYVAQGGDWGSSVSGWLGYEGAGCRAVHLNFTLGWTNPAARAETAEEKAAEGKLAERWRSEGGYMVIQSTKPVTLSFAMADSPLGAAAWIVEKFHRWSALKDGDLFATFTRDQLLDNIMAYVATDTFGTASWLYRGVYDEPVPAGARVEKPTGVANFPGELARFPRSTVEKSFDVVRWTEMAAGGHFAAMEEPALFADEVHAFVRQLDGGG